MKREILEAQFPGIDGVYEEKQTDRGWSAVFTTKFFDYMIRMIDGEFSASIIPTKPHVNIKLKAILLLAEHENQPK